MKICYFGNYNPDYARNRVIIRGLKENGVEVLECNSHKNGWKLFKELFKKHKKIKNKYDILIIGQSDNRFIVPFAWLLTKKIIIWDAFYSIYDSWVFDRKLFSKYHLKAFVYWFLEWLECLLSDKILLDTNEHIKYFIKTFKINKDKFIRVLVGADISALEDINNYSAGDEHDDFLVYFYGNYIPLQGIEYIIDAAKELEKYQNIKFKLIGSGQTFKQVLNKSKQYNLQNIEFIEKFPYKILLENLKKADVCLGIFGNTPKAQRVIPNKAYDAIALGKPLITADTPAIRELFIDRKNVLLCKTANGKSLAEKILELNSNLGLQTKIAQGGLKLFKECCEPKQISERLLEDIRKYGNK